MSMNHVQSFWDVPIGTGDIGPDLRAKVTKVALILSQNPDVVHAVFTGGHIDAEPPELSLITRIELKPQSLKTAIKEAFVAQNVSVKLNLQHDVRYYDFSKTELDNFAAAARVPDLAAAHGTIDELAQVPFQPQEGPPPSTADVLASFAAAAAGATNIPPSQIAEGFSISEERFQQLRTAHGSAIEEHIKGLAKTFAALQNETKTNAAVAIMVAGQLVAKVGGVGGVAGIIAAIAVAFGLLWVILKDALNVCLVVNSRDHLTFGGDCIKNGERGAVVEYLPSASISPPHKPGAVPCGFFVYQKYNVNFTAIPAAHPDPTSPSSADPEAPVDPECVQLGVPVGFYGSCVGMDFMFSGYYRFAVGMDCPNTLFGGSNSIRVTTNSAEDAAQQANDNGTEEQSITFGPYRCTVRRASPWGSTNYGLCLIE